MGSLDRRRPDTPDLVDFGTDFAPMSLTTKDLQTELRMHAISPQTPQHLQVNYL